MEQFILNLAPFFHLPAWFSKNYNAHPDLSSQSRPLTKNPIAKSLTFNLGVTLLLEHLSTPESEENHEGRDETVQWKDKGTFETVEARNRALKIAVEGAILNWLSRGKYMGPAAVWWSTECLSRWSRQSADPGEGWGGLTACKWKRLKRRADYAWVFVQPQKGV